MVNPALVTGLSHPMGIALEGDNLFVVNRLKGTGTIGEYTIMNGTVTAMKPSLVKTGLHNPIGIAVAGGDLFVANHTGTIGEFPTSGGQGNPPLSTRVRQQGCTTWKASRWEEGICSSWTTRA
jgi:glucose/arabinose dehydrogenase